MNLSPLSAAAAAQPTGTAATDGTATGQPQDLFAALLQSGQSAVSHSPVAGVSEDVPVDGELLLQDVLPAAITSTDTGTDTDESLLLADAPWPPPGLETLLGSPITPTPPAGVAPQVTVSAADVAAAMPAATSQTPPAPLAAPTTAAASTPAVLPGATAPGGSLMSADAMADAGKPAIEVQTASPLQAGTRAALAGAEQELLPQNGTNTAGGTGFASLMSITSGLGPATPTPLLPPETPTALSLQGDQVAQELGESVEWILDQKIQSARIRVSPDQMGTIDVEIRLEGDRVHAHFASTHAEVRQILNDSLPRLRELLGEHGMQLGQTDVASHSHDRAADAPAGGAPGSTGTASGSSDEAAPRLVTPLAPRGLLDTYA